MSDKPDDSVLLDLTAQIVSAHISHNPVPADGLPPLITSVLKTLREAGTAGKAAKRDPAAPINKSVFRDHIVCLECGASFKMLKRHLRTDHGQTPETYREKWGLGRSYPLVASDYAQRRSALAKQIGLGTKPRATSGDAPQKAQARKKTRRKAA